MLDAAIADVARRQGGVFTHEQAVRVGATRTMIERRVRTGRWDALQRGVYAIAGIPRSLPVRLMAACLAGGEASGISHRSAIDLWTGATTLRTPAEVTVRREVRRTSPDIVVHRSRDLVPEHVTERCELPVTTPARTLVDLGQVAPWWEVERALDTFLSRRLVSLAAVRAAVVVHSRQGRRGVGTLRRVLDRRSLLHGLSDASVLEAAFARLCLDAGIPAPAFQHRLVLAGRERFVDFSYPAIHLAVEVDGFEFHSAPTQFEDDRVRGNELLLAGWQVLHFSWNQVIHRPTYVAATLRRGLARSGTLETSP